MKTRTTDRAVAPAAADVEALFRHLKPGGPGGAVGVAFGGQVAYRGAFGLADAQTRMRLGPNLRFPIGAASNHFVALAYLRLCEHGRAQLDAPIGDYVEGLQPRTAAATARQLLSHTSGIRDVTEIAMQFSGYESVARSEQLLALYASIADAEVKPGERWSYNHGGYLLISHAIERITGEPLETVLRRTVFEPAGLYDTLLRRHHRGVCANSASTHSSGEAGFERSRLGPEVAGEGGVVSTINDVLRWLDYLNRPHSRDRTSLEAMQAPAQLRNGASTHYGMGWMRKERHGVPIQWHIAGAWGASAALWRCPSLDLNIVVLANTTGLWAESIAEAMFDLCVGATPAAVARASAPTVGASAFSSPATGRVVELSDDPAGVRVSVDGMASLYEAAAPDLLRSAGASAFLQREIVLHRRDNTIAGLRFHEFGVEDELFPLASGEHDAGEILGDYILPSTRTSASIIAYNDGYRLTTHGAFGNVAFALTPIAPNVWRARSASFLGAVLRFDRQGFHYSAERLTRVRFQRLANERVAA